MKSRSEISSKGFQRSKFYTFLSYLWNLTKALWTIIVRKTWAFQLWVLTVLVLGLIVSSTTTVFSLPDIPKLPNGAVNTHSNEHRQYQNVLELLRLSFIYLFFTVYSMLANFGRLAIDHRILLDPFPPDKSIKIVLFTFQFVGLFLPFYILLNGFYIFIGVIGYVRDKSLGLAYHPMQQDFISRSLILINRYISVDPALTIFVMVCIGLIIAITASAYQNHKKTSANACDRKRTPDRP